MQEQYRLLVDEQLICGTAGPRRGLRPRPRRADRPADRPRPARAAGPVGQLAVLERARHRLLRASAPSSGSAGPRPARPARSPRRPSTTSSWTTSSARGVIADAKMAYFDVRPSSHAPTLELRVCDACPLVDDAVLIAGIFRALVRAAELEIAEAEPFVPPRRPVAPRRDLAGRPQRAVPRAARRQPPPPTAARPPRSSGTWWTGCDRSSRSSATGTTVTELAETALARGNSADRQRAAFAERGELEDVMRLVVAETHGTAGGPPADAAGPAPLPGAGRRRGGRARSSRAAGLPRRHRRPSAHGSARARRQARGAPGRLGRRARPHLRRRREQRPFEVDLVPRILSPHEWESCAAGLTQRAWAIESFLRDVYGEQRILRDGVLPRDGVLGSPGWRDEATRLPAGRRPGTGHGLRPGPQRVRRLARAGGQRPLPERRRLRHRRPRT